MKTVDSHAGIEKHICRGFFFKLKHPVCFGFFCCLQFEINKSLKMYLLAGSRSVKLHSDHRLCSMPLWYVARSELVSVIT